MNVSPEQRRQAIDAAAEAAYERDRAAGMHWKHTLWWMADESIQQCYRDKVTGPVDAVLRCVSLPAVDPVP